MIRSIVLLAVAVIFVGCGEKEKESNSVNLNQLSAASFNSEHAPTVEFNVPDMMCAEGCGVAVKEILARQPGVKDVTVDFDGKVATVAVEEGKFDADQALAALIDRQFTNSSLKDGVVAKPQAAEVETEAEAVQ
jgi:copper chaperone CopZ